MGFGFDIETYKSKFSGGARSFLFYVNFTFPGFSNSVIAANQGALGSEGMQNIMNTGGDLQSFQQAGESAYRAGVPTAIDATNLSVDTTDFPYYVKSTSLPMAGIEEIATHWCGQTYKIAGIPTYDDWTVTLNVDTTAMVLKRFGDWHKMIRNPLTNVIGRPVTYTADQEVHLLAPNGDTVCMYKLYGAWPKTIGTVALDYSDTSIAAVDITFTYQYHVIHEKKPGALQEFAKKYAWGGIGGQIYNTI